MDITLLDKFIGQTKLIKLLKQEVAASEILHQPLPSMVFGGLPGLGKNLLASIIAQARGVKLLQYMGQDLSESLLPLVIESVDRSGYDDKDNGFVSRPHETKPTIVFIDECENVPTKIWELWHGLLQPSPEGRYVVPIKVAKNRILDHWCPALSFILATNYIGRLRKKAPAATNRCAIRYRFEPYTVDELCQIIAEKADNKNVEITDEAIQAIAKRSLGTPRTADLIFGRCLSKLVSHTRRQPTKADVITERIVMETFSLMGIDDMGLDPSARDYLKAIASTPNGKMALDTIASVSRIDKETIVVDIEPFLLQQQLVEIVSGGRQLTDAGLLRMGKEGNKLHQYRIQNQVI